LLESLGIDSRRISLDPGCGFGKTVTQNYALISGLDQLAQAGYPVLLGVSRKSMIGAVTGRPVTQRLVGSIAAALAGVARGAAIIRVHDVAETRNAVEHGVDKQ
jgi:dihydropteroate synthase